MEQYRTLRAYSAGGVVFRLMPASTALKQGSPQQQNTHWYAFSETPEGQSREIQVALVGRSYPGIWVLPKGTPQSGETIEQVALREVQEETGLRVRLIAYIGSISYWFARDQVRYHKQVRHFLLEAIGGDITLHDHEYDLVAWFPWGEACRLLTYQNEVNILYQAEDILQRWLHHEQPEEGQT